MNHVRGSKEWAAEWLAERNCQVGTLRENGKTFVVVPDWSVADDSDFGEVIAQYTNHFEGWGFADEYDSCSECGGILRTSPDSYVWTPDFWDSPDGRVCVDCLDPEDYIEWVIDENGRGIARSVNLIDPTEFGFVKVLDGLEHGLHEGQNDDPRIIGKWGSKHGLAVVFTIYPSQFTMTFDLYVRCDNGESLTDSQLTDLRGALLTDPDARYPTLRREFKQFPTPADCMKTGLREAARVGSQFTTIHADGSITDHGSFEAMTA